MSQRYAMIIIAIAAVAMMVTLPYTDTSSAESENGHVFEEGFAYESVKLSMDDYTDLMGDASLLDLSIQAISMLNLPTVSSDIRVWDVTVTSLNSAYFQDWYAGYGDTSTIYSRTYSIHDVTFSFKAVANSYAEGLNMMVETNTHGYGDQEFLEYLGKDTLSEGDALELTISARYIEYSDNIESLNRVTETSFLTDNENMSYYDDVELTISSAAFTSGSVTKNFTGHTDSDVRGAYVSHVEYTPTGSAQYPLDYDSTTVTSDVENDNMVDLTFNGSDHAFSYARDTMSQTEKQGHVTEDMYITINSMDSDTAMSLYFYNAKVPVSEFMHSHGTISTGYIHTYRQITEHYENEFSGITIAEDALTSALKIMAVVIMVFVLIIVALIVFIFRRRNMYLKEHEKD